MKSMDPPLLDQLPAELLVHVLSYLSPKELFLRARHVNRRWRSTIQSNLKRLLLIPVHCSVDVMDMEGHSEANDDGTNPMIQYTFTVFDRKLDDYKKKLRQCKSGNAQWSKLWVSHRQGQMECEWEDYSNQSATKLDPAVAETLLSYMLVEAIRVDVRKQGRKTVARLTDDRFAHALQWCESVCAAVRPRSLLLSSRSPSFPWCFSALSQKRLSNLREVRYITLENMTSLDCFGQGKVIGGVDLGRTQSLQLRMDATHCQDIENILWVELDGDLLYSLLEAHERCLDFSAYPNVPQAITTIKASDMTQFIKSWRNLSSPWFIRQILFNSTVTISEFRTVASRCDLFTKHHLDDIPYCRFRTFHPADPNVLLELSCYGNRNSTQWQIRSGYPTTPKRAICL